MKMIGKFNLEVYGYRYIDKIASVFQLAPMWLRSYIEGRPVEELSRGEGYLEVALYNNLLC